MALGCTLVVLALVIGVVLVGGCIAFAESGADTGKTTLLDADAYDFDTFTYEGERNYFLNRMPSGEFVAVSDLDAANRANASRQCRATIVHPQDPAYKRLIEDYGEQISAEAGSSEFLFREACNDAVYDLAGVLVSGEGRNLDQFRVTIDRRNQVIVDVSKRTCTERRGTDQRVEVAC